VGVFSGKIIIFEHLRKALESSSPAWLPAARSIQSKILCGQTENRQLAIFYPVKFLKSNKMIYFKHTTKQKYCHPYNFIFTLKPGYETGSGWTQAQTEIAIAATADSFFGPLTSRAVSAALHTAQLGRIRCHSGPEIQSRRHLASQTKL